MTNEEDVVKETREKDIESMTEKELKEEIAKVTKKMNQAAAELRDKLMELKVTLRDYHK